MNRRQHHWPYRLAGAAVALWILLGGASPVHAAATQVVTLRGGGCPAQSPAIVMVDGERRVSELTDTKGNYAIDVEVPREADSTLTLTCGAVVMEVAVPGRADDHESRLGLAALVVGVGATLSTMIVLVRRRIVIDLRDPPLQSETRPASETAEAPAR